MGTISGTSGTTSNSVITTENSAANEERKALLKEAVELSMDTAYGIQRMNDQQIGQLLGGLVRTKLLSADDSYRLRDQLLDTESFNRLIHRRIEATLRRRGLAAA